MMIWKQLLSTTPTNITLPWIGGRTLIGHQRTWKVQGELPTSFGWHEFEISGNKYASWKQEAFPDVDWFSNRNKNIQGYLVGNRLIPDNIGFFEDMKLFFQKTTSLFLTEPGMQRFSRVSATHWNHGKYIFQQMEFPLGPETEVLEAFFNKETSVTDIPFVTPALELAFRFETWQRERKEAYLRAQEEKRKERERQQQILEKEERMRKAYFQQSGTGQGRRELAKVDFETAAKAALSVSGAELLDSRPSYQKGEMVVQFRHEQRNFECVVERHTLQIIDAGICLIDHSDETKHDHLFTLESLPPVISQAIREGVLVVFRHI